MEQNIDIKEIYIYQLDANLLTILLLDKSSGKNIIWATDNYAERGFGYQSSDQIMVDSITHRNGSVIKPRTTKSKKEQAIRVRDKAEVFTPSWVCNNQNNLVDNAWFGRENVFNTENGQTWITSAENITFSEGRTWQDYVKANRMEISCGEAPYLASRYDTEKESACLLQSARTSSAPCKDCGRTEKPGCQRKRTSRYRRCYQLSLQAAQRYLRRQRTHRGVAQNRGFQSAG